MDEPDNQARPVSERLRRTHCWGKQDSVRVRGSSAGSFASALPDQTALPSSQANETYLASLADELWALVKELADNGGDWWSLGIKGSRARWNRVAELEAEAHARFEVGRQIAAQ